MFALLIIIEFFSQSIGYLLVIAYISVLVFGNALEILFNVLLTTTHKNSSWPLMLLAFCPLSIFGYYLKPTIFSCFFTCC